MDIESMNSEETDVIDMMFKLQNYRKSAAAETPMDDGNNQDDADGEEPEIDFRIQDERAEVDGQTREQKKLTDIFPGLKLFVGSNEIPGDRKKKSSRGMYRRNRKTASRVDAKLRRSIGNDGKPTNQNQIRQFKYADEEETIREDDDENNGIGFMESSLRVVDDDDDNEAEMRKREDEMKTDSTKEATESDPTASPDEKLFKSITLEEESHTGRKKSNDSRITEPDNKEFTYLTCEEGDGQMIKANMDGIIKVKETNELWNQTDREISTVEEKTDTQLKEDGKAGEKPVNGKRNGKVGDDITIESRIQQSYLYQLGCFLQEKTESCMHEIFSKLYQRYRHIDLYYISGGYEEHVDQYLISAPRNPVEQQTMTALDWLAYSFSVIMFFIAFIYVSELYRSRRVK